MWVKRVECDTNSEINQRLGDFLVCGPLSLISIYSCVFLVFLNVIRKTSTALTLYMSARSGCFTFLLTFLPVGCIEPTVRKFLDVKGNGYYQQYPDCGSFFLKTNLKHKNKLI
jgi:hypothetical protein